MPTWTPRPPDQDKALLLPASVLMEEMWIRHGRNLRLRRQASLPKQSLLRERRCAAPAMLFPTICTHRQVRRRRAFRSAGRSNLERTDRWAQADHRQVLPTSPLVKCHRCHWSVCLETTRRVHQEQRNLTSLPRSTTGLLSRATWTCLAAHRVLMLVCCIHPTPQTSLSARCQHPIALNVWISLRICLFGWL